MRRLALLLATVSLSCLAQEKPKAGFVGHNDCRVYFVSDSFIYHRLPDPPLATLARMTDAEKEQWRRSSVIRSEFDDLALDEEKWWTKKEHAKYSGLCYVPHSYLNDQRNPALNGPLFAIYFTETDSSRIETQMATETNTRDVPVEGSAPVYDEYGQNIGTARVDGTVRVETTTSYPIDVRIDLDNVDATVWGLTGPHPEQLFRTLKSRRGGDGGMAGMIEAFQRSPRENARHDCLKFLMLETGLKKK